MHMVEKIYLADYLLTQTGRTRYSKNMQFFFFFFDKLWMKVLQSNKQL